MEQQQQTALDYIDLGLDEVQPSDGDFAKLKPGEYEFEVVKVEGRQSRAGNPLMAVNYKVARALLEANEDQVGLTNSLDVASSRSSRHVKWYSTNAVVSTPTT
jgi:hypothetical protein